MSKKNINFPTHLKNTYFMKKFYYLFLMLGSFSYAQVTVFDQPNNGTNGIVSNVLSTGNAVYAADDFTLAQTTRLTKLTVRGFQNEGSFLTFYQGLRMVIYTNNPATNIPSGIPSGTPGTILAELNVGAVSPGVDVFQEVGAGPVSIEIDFLSAFAIDIILQPLTTYWLTIAPKVNLTAYIGATRFNWYVGIGAAGINYNAKLVDPLNVFGAGATNWTNISTLTNEPAFNNLSFTFEGDTNLSLENVKAKGFGVYPNPAIDVLNIAVNNTDFENLSYEISDINGRRVIETKDASINVQSLNTGVYFLTIFSNNTKIGVEKIVKK
jgi:hypothetical protein